MPYPADHKTKTRARIIESARVMFNRRGFEQVTIDDIMNNAGLTRGGFYHHFSSKDELYAEAVRSFSGCNPFAKKLASLKRRPDALRLARILVELYLADEILEDVDQHCPLVALPSDVARAGLVPRAAYTQVIQNMLRVFRGAFAEHDASAEDKAQVMINLLVGGMVLARTTDDLALRRSLRAAARAQALALLATASLAPKASGGSQELPVSAGERRAAASSPKARPSARASARVRGDARLPPPPLSRENRRLA